MEKKNNPSSKNRLLFFFIYFTIFFFFKFQNSCAFSNYRSKFNRETLPYILYTYIRTYYLYEYIIILYVTYYNTYNTSIYVYTLRYKRLLKQSNNKKKKKSNRTYCIKVKREKNKFKEKKIYT